MKLPIRLRLKRVLDRFRREHDDIPLHLTDGYVSLPTLNAWYDPKTSFTVHWKSTLIRGGWYRPDRLIWTGTMSGIKGLLIHSDSSTEHENIYLSEAEFTLRASFDRSFTFSDPGDFVSNRRSNTAVYLVNVIIKRHIYLVQHGEEKTMVDISMTADIVNPRFGVLGAQAKTNGNQYFFEFALNCEDDGTVNGSSGTPGSLVFDTPPIVGKAFRDINPDNRLVLSFDSGGFYTLDLGNSTSVSQTGRNLLRQFDRAIVEAVCSDILLGDTTGLLRDSEKVWNTAFLEDVRDVSDPSTKDEWMYDLIMQEYNNVHPRVSADTNGVKSMVDMASGSLTVTSLNVLRRLRFRTTSNYRARLEYFFTFGLSTLKSENLNGSSALLSDYSKNWPLNGITEDSFPINLSHDEQPIFVNLVTEVKDWGNILCPPSSHGQVSTDAYLYPIPYVFQRTSDSGLRTVYTNTSGTYGGEHVPYGHLEMIDDVYNSKSEYVGPQVLEDYYPLP